MRIELTFEERRLYHQIHPAKLITDISTAFVSIYLLWKQLLYLAIVLAIVPSVIATIIVMMTADLDQYKNSSFGHYAKKYMNSRFIDIVRLSGFIIMALGGWYQLIYPILIGFVIILVCWTRGLVLNRKMDAA